jgi:hypothetical protein
MPDLDATVTVGFRYPGNPKPVTAGLNPSASTDLGSASVGSEKAWITTSSQVMPVMTSISTDSSQT